MSNESGISGKSGNLDKSWSQKTLDGFKSFAARLGLGMDNLLSSSGYAQGKKVSDHYAELEEMYRTSWIVGRVVEVVAKDMVRTPMDLQGDMSQEDISILLRTYRSLGIPSRMMNALQWSRLYGGSIAIMLFDGHDVATPLELDNIAQGSFKGLYVLDSTQVTPSVERITELGPLLGYPAYYTVNGAHGMESLRVHYSRALRFVGVELPERQREARNSFGDSVVERIYDRILALDSATHGAANLFLRSYLRVIRLQGYREALAEGGRAEEAIHNMFKTLSLLQSNEGLTVLDKEDEFATHNWSFAGVYDGMQAFSEQVAGGSSIPLVRLLGQSPKGFSTGESDLRTYYDTILSYVEDDKRPVDSLLFQVLSYHLWGKALPPDFSVEYSSLYTPTEVEKSAIAMQDAQSIAGLYQSGVIGKGQSLEALKDASRITGRFGGITDDDINEAEGEDQAPALPEGFEPVPLNSPTQPDDLPRQ